jgi:4-amino-4-deoxychorismate lyase
LILVNGFPLEHLHVSDRAIQYGDGVFRTLRATSEQLVGWKDQHAKLAADAHALGLVCPPDGLLRAECIDVAENRPCLVKVILTRGIGQRGYAPPNETSQTRIVVSSDLPNYPATFILEGIKVRWCSLKLGHQPRLAGIKHLNRLENVLARAEWTDPDIAEGLLLDERGWVICGVMSNLLVIRGNTLYTPDLSQCGVAGVTRRRIMLAAQKHGMQVRVTQMRPRDIFKADEVCMCNSVMGVWRVRMIEDMVCGGQGWTERIRVWLNDDD